MSKLPEKLLPAPQLLGGPTVACMGEKDIFFQAHVIMGEAMHLSHSLKAGLNRRPYLMTTPEHTLVGLHAALAFGCHRRWGWPVVVMAGLASNAPDWDGLPMLVDMQSFERGHRVWGHNVFMISLTALLVSWLEHRFHWVNWLGKRLQAIMPSDVVLVPPSVPAAAPVYFLTALVAQAIHLPCDMVVSGGQGLTDWPVQPFWPVSGAGYAFPLIPWGDVGPTVILMAGMLAVAKTRSRCSVVSALTLVILLAYLGLRGWMRGTFSL